MSSRLWYKRLQYQVIWKGWDPDPKFYNASNFKNGAEILQKYHKEYPDKPGPPLRLQNWLQAIKEDRFDPDHLDDNKPALGSGRLQVR